MSGYEKARAALLLALTEFRDEYALGFDMTEAVRKLIYEIEDEE